MKAALKAYWATFWTGFVLARDEQPRWLCHAHYVMFLMNCVLIGIAVTIGHLGIALQAAFFAVFFRWAAVPVYPWGKKS